MTRSKTAQAGRDRSRPQGARRGAWVRPFLRAHRALDSSFRLIAASLHVAARSERCASRRPIRSSQNLLDAGTKLVTASHHLTRVVKALKQTNACLGRNTGGYPPELPQLLLEAAQRWAFMTQWLQDTSDDLLLQHLDVLEGLARGTLVSERRPRIVLAPRPVPVRAFLAARQPRATDRISSILQRRRRTPRPAALSVPPRASQGRAPPFSPIGPR